jgi:hypothetical protein
MYEQKTKKKVLFFRARVPSAKLKQRISCANIFRRVSVFSEILVIFLNKVLSLQKISPAQVLMKRADGAGVSVIV